jgi:hypothetical protein
MPTNFLSLPSELRNKIYEQLVVDHEPIDPRFGHNLQYKLTPGLLRANKIIHREASSLLYAQNRFDFTVSISEDVASFLEQIGRNNATYIQHIYIRFPQFFYLDLHDVTLEDDSLRILAKIQSDCTNLSTLTTSLGSTNSIELRLDELDHPKIVSEALALVDARFRAISSLREIIVEVYENGPSGHIRREMKRHGWTIDATENVEEQGSDISFGIEYDYPSFDDTWDDEYYIDRDDGYYIDRDYGYYIDRDDEYEYDIDNDDDFWRRAGD